jgi:signal transduction histidine kinase
MNDPTAPSQLCMLVVDDDEDTVQSTADALALYGYRVLAATCGAEALRLAVADPPDAALLDLSMPVMDGFEVARHLCTRRPPGLPRPVLVAVTGQTSVDRIRTAAAGFDLHLTKPVEPGALAATARALVGLRRAEERLEARVTARTAELEAEMARRQELARRLASAQEDERRRVARDLHDTIGQTLSGLSLAAAAGQLDQVRRLADELGRELHEVAVRLRPTALDDIGLAAAARVLADDWARRTGVAIEFQAVGLGAGRLPAEVETALYRVVQEALTNAAKHAAARRVAVVIGRRAGTAVAVVEDDGAGFDPDVARTPAPGRRAGLGLAGMRERVGLLGGTVEVESQPGQGTTVFARIPLAETPAGAGRA